ncbi:unnamed protein product [Cochlearia groenlandica]
MLFPFEEDHQVKKVVSLFSSFPCEPTSVLSPLTTTSSSSSSTVSSSLGGNSAVGGGGGGGSISTSISGDAFTDDQCLHHWDHNHHHQDHHDNNNILRLIMGEESQDPSFELNNILQTPSSSQSFSAFGVVDTAFSLLDHSLPLPPPPPPLFHTQTEHKPPPLVINQSQTLFTHNPTLFQGGGGGSMMGVGYTDVNKHGMITEHLLKAAEVIESGGDTCLALEILARLNQQQLSSPLERSAFYFKEALINLLNDNSSSSSSSSSNNSFFLLNPYSLIFKISAYKSFSEISPLLHFSNFTSNQALLDAFNGFHRLHIIDFDIGYGGQWASLMQELVLRDNNTGSPLSLKITVFVSPTNHDQLELGFTQDNLKHFASEINISLDIKVLSFELMGSVLSEEEEEEAVAVNLSASSFSDTPSYLPLALRFLKHLSPKIIVCSDKGCERTDLPFAQHIVHSMQSQAALLQSLDAVNANADVMQKIERFLIQPEIEKIVIERSRRITRERSVMMMMTWQDMLSEMGFAPVTHSNMTESQAECLVQRTPVRGFHVEKRHNKLLLYWQRTQLVGVSAWKSPS